MNILQLSSLLLAYCVSAQVLTRTTTICTETVYSTTTLSAPAPTDILAQGILENIDLQVNELAYVQLLLAEVTATTALNTTLYLANKASLLAVQSSGVAVRANNQAIAPAGNAAIPGLSAVAGAQQTEIALASALSGNVVCDPQILDVLRADRIAG